MRTEERTVCLACERTVCVMWDGRLRPHKTRDRAGWCVPPTQTRVEAARTARGRGHRILRRSRSPPRRLQQIPPRVDPTSPGPVLERPLNHP